MLATLSTLSSLNSQKTRLTRILTIPGGGSSSVAQDNSGNIWLSSVAAKQLYSIDPRNNYSYSLVTVTTTNDYLYNLSINNNNLVVNTFGSCKYIQNFTTKLGANAVALTYAGPTNNFCGVFIDGYNVYTLPGNINKCSITALGGNGTVTNYAGGGASYQDNVLATNTSLSLPNNLSQCVINNGYFYFCDVGNSVIRRINISTNIISLVAGTPQINGFSGDGGLAISCKLDGPSGIIFDSAGNLYISDSNNSCIRIVNTSGTISKLVSVAYPFQLLIDINNNLIIATSTSLYSYKLS